MSEPMPAPSPERDPAAGRSRSALRVALLAALCPSLGALLGLALVPTLLARFGHGGLTRILRLGQHLDGARYDERERPTALLLGSSVVREGLDAAAVEAAAPGWAAENLALTGCATTELGVLLPRVLEARPRLVVLGLRPEGSAGSISRVKCMLYAQAGFVRAWSDGGAPVEVDGATLAALRASSLERRFELRTGPLMTLEDAIRRRVRRGELRVVAPDAWRAPYEMTASLRGRRLQRHVDHVLRREADAHPLQLAAVAAMGELCRAAGVSAHFLLVPLHPSVREPLAPALDALREAARAAGTLHDASALLDADAMADAVHPAASGRARLSTWLGARLPRP